MDRVEKITIAAIVVVFVVLLIALIYAADDCVEGGGRLEYIGSIPIITNVNGIMVTNMVPQYKCVMPNED